MGLCGAAGQDGMIPVLGPWQMSLSHGARSGLERSTGGLSLQLRTEVVLEQSLAPGQGAEGVAGSGTAVQWGRREKAEP